MFKSDREYYEDTSHISSSMIKTYLTSPAYYKARYVDKTIENKQTAALDFGSALDIYLTEGEKNFHKQVQCSVLKKEDPDLYEEQKTFDGIILSKSVYDKVLLCAQTVQDTLAYKTVEAFNPVPQTILTGHWHGAQIKGKLDWLNVISDTAWITDLKTTTNIHPTKYYYHCLDYQYAIQMCMYRELVRQNYPQVNTIVCQHLVVTKGQWPQVGTFVFSKVMMDQQLSSIEYAIKGITAKRFDDPDVSWDNAIILKPKEYDETVSTSESDTEEES